MFPYYIIVSCVIIVLNSMFRQTLVLLDLFSENDINSEPCVFEEFNKLRSKMHKMVF